MSRRAELCNTHLIHCGSAATRMNTEAYGSRRNERRERNDQPAEVGHVPSHFYRRSHSVSLSTGYRQKEPVVVNVLGRLALGCAMLSSADRDVPAQIRGLWHFGDYGAPPKRRGFRRAFFGQQHKHGGARPQLPGLARLQRKHASKAQAMHEGFGGINHPKRRQQRHISFRHQAIRTLWRLLHSRL